MKAGPIAALAWLTACAPAPPPNVLLVVVDTLRTDHCSSYGYARETTPRLTALAAEGVRFERAYAPIGLTGPSHASLFTALHPVTHGLSQNGLALDASHVTLAERLREHGYQTAAVVSSFVLTRRFGLAQGFDHYDESLDVTEATTRLDSWEGHGVPEGFDRRADHTTRRARDWLESQRDPARPFFLFVHYFDPHSPWEPPPGWAGRFEDGLEDPHELDRILARYDAEVAFTDAMLGELVDALDAAGLAESTLVMVTADHGEGLLQRGYLLHGLGVFEEEVRVPLVARWKGELPEGLSVPEPVALVDVVPTLAELVGLELREEESQGHSFAASLRGRGGLDPQRPVYLQRRSFARGVARPDIDTYPDGRKVQPYPVEGEQFGLRRGRWKYVLGREEGVRTLYDLERDPGETQNVIAENEPRAQRMDEALDLWVRAHRRRGRTATVPEEDLRRLRALGYLD